MRVTITVDSVLREIDVRSDLLAQGMGEWQDATEMDLLRAFGSAYKEAAANARATTSPDTVQPEPEHVEPEPEHVEPEPEHVEPEPEHVEPEPEHVEPEHVEPDIGLYDTLEPVADPVFMQTDHNESQNPFAEATIDNFGQAQAYVASTGDAEAFLSPVLSVATETPVVTTCRCGHAVGWHASEVPDVTAACLMVWPIDEHEPQGPASKCACLQFEPADLVLPVPE